MKQLGYSCKGRYQSWSFHGRACLLARLSATFGHVSRHIESGRPVQTQSTADLQKCLSPARLRDNQAKCIYPRQNVEVSHRGNAP